MKAWTIVGYAFNADHYCDGICILRALGEIGPVVYRRANPDINGKADWREISNRAADLTNRALARRFDGRTEVEECLGVIAERRGIDKDNERSYDSGSFPKVIFASEEFPDYCPRCALCHGVLDGFDEADYKSGEDCDECGETIPDDDDESTVNTHHATSCSLHSANITDDTKES